MRRIVLLILLVAAGVDAQESLSLSVLAEGIVDRVARLERTMADFDGARTFFPAETSYYPSFVFPVDASEIVLVCGIDAAPYVFEAAMDVLGTFTVIISGVPYSPSGGARAVLDSPVLDRSAAHVFVRSGDRTEWGVGSGRLVSPGWLVEAIVNGDGSPVLAPSLLLFERRGAAVSPAVPELIAGGVPAAELLVAPGDSWTLLDRFTAVRNELPLNRVADINYTVLPPLRRDGPPYVIREALLVLGVFVSIALLLLYAHIRPRRALRYARALGRRLPTIVVFLLTMTIGLLAANGVLRLVIGEARAAGGPAALLVLKASVAALVVGLSFRLYRVRLSTSTTVYAAGAIVLLVLAAIITAVVSLPLSIYPISMLVGAFLFSLAPSAWTKSVLLAATLVPPLYLLTGGALLQEEFAILLARQPLWSEPIVAVFVLPVFLMLLRLEYLTPRVKIVRIVSIVSLFALFLAAILVSVEVADEPVVAVIAEERSPEGTTVAIDPVPPAQTTLVAIDGSEVLLACTDTPCVTEMPGNPSTFAVAVARRTELNRSVLEIDLTFDRPAREVSFTLVTEGGAVLYRSDVPADPAIGAEAGSFTFYPGSAPPTSVTHSVALIPNVEGAPIQVSAAAIFPGTTYRVAHPAGRIVAAESRTREVITVTVRSGG